MVQYCKPFYTFLTQYTIEHQLLLHKPYPLIVRTAALDINCKQVNEWFAVDVMRSAKGAFFFSKKKGLSY